MKVKGIFFCLAAVLMCQTAVYAAAEIKVVQTAKPNNTVYTENTLNIPVTAKQPTFTIKLRSNPTTGFSWFLREFDSNLITPVKRAFLPPDNDLVGASGYEEWTFRVKPNAFLVPHQTTIRMIYARPWQGSDGATQIVYRISTSGK